MSWRHGQPAPKKCPLCGYDKSQEDLERIKAKLADAKSRELDKAYENMIQEAIMKLPWWKRWAIGMGLRRFIISASADGKVQTIGGVTYRRRLP